MHHHTVANHAGGLWGEEGMAGGRVWLVGRPAARLQGHLVLPTCSDTYTPLLPAAQGRPGVDGPAGSGQQLRVHTLGLRMPEGMRCSLYLLPSLS